MQLTESHKQYWSKNVRMTGILLAIWFIVTFVVGYYARDLSFNFFGWPFSFLGRCTRRFSDLCSDHCLLRALHEQLGQRIRLR